MPTQTLPTCDYCGKPAPAGSMANAEAAGWRFPSSISAPDGVVGYCPDCRNDLILCWRCAAVITGWELSQLHQLAGDAMPDPSVRTEAGTLWTAGDAHYCAECAPHVRVCRKCGCTDENACEDGCHWTQDDLCSAYPA